MEDIMRMKNEFDLRRKFKDDMRLDELIERLILFKENRKLKKFPNPFINIEVKFGSEIRNVRISDIRIDKNNEDENEIYIESRREGVEKKGRKGMYGKKLVYYLKG